MRSLQADVISFRLPGALGIRFIPSPEGLEGGMMYASPEAASDYRYSHIGAGTAANYQEYFSRCLPGSYWRSVERPIFAGLLQQALGNRSLAELTCLDIATGSGRVLEALHGRTKSAVGLDISDDMLAHAKVTIPGARFITCDASTMELGEQFDLVTAFRFFLNAQPSLRAAVLDRIRAHLAPGGMLVANIHAQPWSVLGTWRGLRRSLGFQADDVMAIGEFRELLAAHGFRVVADRTYGYLPLYYRLRSPLAIRAFCRLDQRFNRSVSRPNPFASCWMVAARCEV